MKNRVLRDIVAISAGDFHAAALTRDGKVFTWGYGEEGQLGHGNRSNLSTPRLLENVDTISSVSCGGGHTGVITSTGQVLMFGRGRDGQLGRAGQLESVASYRTSPLLVTKFGDMKITRLTLGSDHTIAMT
ncbi:MAG: hypothetical protein V2I33_22405 [Kangiellaceae bacterium]|nr:hypothetical protein [Kangiellaceae bacterium]